jgi:hypothetical protein
VTHPSPASRPAAALRHFDSGHASDSVIGTGSEDDELTSYEVGSHEILSSRGDALVHAQWRTGSIKHGQPNLATPTSGAAVAVNFAEHIGVGDANAAIGQLPEPVEERREREHSNHVPDVLAALNQVWRCTTAACHGHRNHASRFEGRTEHPNRVDQLPADQQ